MNESIKNITLDYLYSTPYGVKLKNIIRILEDAQEGVGEFVNIDSKDKLPYLKIGAILLLGMFKKMSCGKMPKDFTSEDLADIADEITQYAIKMDGQEYSAFIFLLYAKYIEYSAKAISAITSKSKADAIEALATELRIKTELLSKGESQESKYIEDCLWICLESMIKLLSAYSVRFVGPKGAEFVDNVSSFTFEYGRYILYKREQEIVAEYLEKQKIVDEELQQKLDQYLMDVEKEQRTFSKLIKNAFDNDFRKSFISSTQLATATGVKETEILNTTKDIDDFFLS